ncbi:hypothetical protein [Sorangium sp. So ce1000]|uniref:hypothetical protein n=1 Tax=Sorangium sp. So ce1000 TaxID=3133325 RepID=UPI003F6414E7
MTADPEWRDHSVRSSREGQTGAFRPRSGLFARRVTEDAAPLLGDAPDAGDWAASSEAAEWEIGHLLSKAARGDYSHPFGADYLIYIDQRLDALLTYRERDSKFAHFPPPVAHTSGGGMTDGAQRIFMRAAASMVGLQIGLNIAGNNIGALLVEPHGAT